MSKLIDKRAFLLIAIYAINYLRVKTAHGTLFARVRTSDIDNYEHLLTLSNDLGQNNPTEDGSRPNHPPYEHGRGRRNIPECKLNGGNCTMRGVDVASWILSGDGNINAIVYWTGKDSKRMFILSCQEVNTTKDREGRSACISKSNIYRSEDYGTTFVKENKKFPHDACIHAVYFSRADDSLVLITDVFHRKLYISKNSGKNYTAVDVPFSPIALTFHPTNLTMILGYSPFNQALYVSTTAGMNWTKVCTERVLRYYWAVPGFDRDMTTIFLEVDHIPFIKLTGNHVSSLSKTHSPYKGLLYPFDENFGHIVRNSLYIEKEYILVQEERTNKLFVSYKRRNFVQCYFPVTDSITHYYVADASENEIIIAVLHGRKTNLYVSDATGQWFTLTLQDVVTSDPVTWEKQFPLVDVHLVEGLRGTYLANKIGRGTLITYDKGASWHYLQAPKIDISGSPTDCILPACSLHLQLYVKRTHSLFGITSVLSKRSAPGLILAQGVLGSSKKSEGQVSVYTSRDGGVLWHHSIDKPFSFIMIDHGSAIITAPLWSFLGQGGSKLQYSCTEGQSWTYLTLSNQVIQIIGLLTESKAESPIVTVFGRHSSWKQFEWTVWRLNFTSAFDYKCSNDNYTIWSPMSSTLTNQSCSLGEHLEFVKRKDNVCCLNGIDFHRPINITRCQCTLEDFECDFGYVRDKYNGKCKKTGEKHVYAGMCKEGNTYLESRGYRKIIGDKCSSGKEKDLIPLERACPPEAPHGFTLLVSKHAVTVDESVKMEFTQRRGFLETRYSWDYGDGVVEKSVNGYQNARSRSHIYRKVGEYSIQLTAVNTAGSYTISTTIFVINRVSRAQLRHCQPAVAAKPCRFHVIVDPAVTHNPGVHGFVHFAWIFDPKERPFLSFSPRVDYVFRHAGSFDVEVQVINAVGVLSVSSVLTVYDKAVEIQVQFSSAIDMLNDESLAWAERFSENLRLYLTKRYNLDKEFLIVKTEPKIPTESSVFAVYKHSDHAHPNSSSEIKGLMTIVHTIVRDLQKSRARVFLGGSSYRILSAEIICHPTESADDSKSTDNSFGLQVGLPIALGISFLAFLLLIYHYHNKCFPGRYRFIRQSRSSQLLDFASLTSSSLSDVSLHPDA